MTSTKSDEMIRLAMLKQIIGETSPQSLNQCFQLGVEAMDDAALFRLSDTESLVIATDFIRGSGFYLFQLGYLNYFDVGYYLIAANVSDIAAMGAIPLGLMNVVRYTADMTDEEFCQVFRGMKAAADDFGVWIVGGDIGGHSSDVFVATAIGIVKTDRVLLRRNVKDGDLLCVTGVIGLPITALTYFKKAKPQGFSMTEQEEERILMSWKRPKPRIKEGRLLSENQIANGCQDVSDGLQATIEQMSAISGKTFTAYADRLPIDVTTYKLADFLKVDPVRIAISASVDFELMFTISSANESRCRRLFEEEGLGFTVIGQVNSEEKNILITPDGQLTNFPGMAWKQQTGDFLADIIGRSS